jgi:hypothetical protein
LFIRIHHNDETPPFWLEAGGGVSWTRPTWAENTAPHGRQSFVFDFYSDMEANGSQQKTKVTFQTTVELERALKRAAAREDRSMSSYIRRAVRNTLAAEGELDEANTRREAAPVA